MNEILTMAETIAPRLAELYHDFHRHPELSAHEYETAERVLSVLKEIEGMEITTGVADTGVVALLHGKKGPGKTVLLRADMDALPIEEQSGVPFASEYPGVMHACGHDGHTTWLLGAALLLGQMRDSFSGTVKFVFQPDEEDASGAKRMVLEEKVLENPKADAVFAAHAWPGVEAGQIAIAEKYAFGMHGVFSIRITGKGGHGSSPHLCVDPIAVAHQIYGALQQVVSRKVDEMEPRVLTIGSIHAGPEERGNIIPHTCIMRGTIRGLKREVMEQMLGEIRSLSCGIAKLNGASCLVEGSYDPAVENDAATTALCLHAAQKVLGEQNAYILHKANLAGEDFAEFTSRVPGTYFYVGIANEETRGKFGLHSPLFKLEESVLHKTAAVFAQLTLDYLNGDKSCLTC